MGRPRMRGRAWTGRGCAAGSPTRQRQTEPRGVAAQPERKREKKRKVQITKNRSRSREPKVEGSDKTTLIRRDLGARITRRRSETNSRKSTPTRINKANSHQVQTQLGKPLYGDRKYKRVIKSARSRCLFSPGQQEVTCCQGALR